MGSFVVEARVVVFEEVGVVVVGLLLRGTVGICISLL